MMTVKQQKDARAASAYFDDHLSGNDYYVGKDRSAGKWFGKLAPELGLRGEVGKEAFDRLAGGLHPSTGKKLTQRLRAGRTAFFDFTCSAPKSVSIVGVVGGDKRVVEAHQRATVEAMAYLERAAYVRERKGADVLTTKRAYTGKVVAAAFDHDSSRALDCQLHRHYCVFNVTPGPDGKLMALDARKMYDRSQTATEVYRNALARDLLGLGYQLDQGKKGFEIRGIPTEWVERFSKRGKTIAREVTRKEQAKGRKLTAREKAGIVHRTRERKVSLSPDDYLAQLRDQLTPAERKALAAVVRCADGTPSPAMRVSERDVLAAVLGRGKPGKRLPGHEVMRRCLEMGRGRVTTDQLERILFSKKRNNPQAQDRTIKTVGKDKARLTVALLARGYATPNLARTLRSVGHLIRELERAWEPPNLID